MKNILVMLKFQPLHKHNLTCTIHKIMVYKMGELSLNAIFWDIIYLNTVINRMNNSKICHIIL